MASVVVEGVKTIGPGPWLPSEIPLSKVSNVNVDGKALLVHDADVSEHRKPGKNPAPRVGKVIASSKVMVMCDDGIRRQAASIGDICTNGQIIVGGGERDNTTVFGNKEE